MDGRDSHESPRRALRENDDPPEARPQKGQGAFGARSSRRVGGSQGRSALADRNGDALVRRVALRSAASSALGHLQREPARLLEQGKADTMNRKRKRSRRARRVYRPRLGAIPTRARFHLARHGRLFALPALVLKERAAARDAAVFALLRCGGVNKPGPVPAPPAARESEKFTGAEAGLNPDEKR